MKLTYKILSFTVFTLLRLFSFFTFFRKKKNPGKLLIEAGTKGWESIEYKELLQSSIEFMGNSAITTQVFSSTLETAKTLHKNKITHFLYDPRTGDDGNFLIFFKAIFLSLFCCIYNITPIAYLTDASDRRWRIAAIFVTAAKGTIITFIKPSSVRELFFHNRVLGPSLVPLSKKLLTNLLKKNIDWKKRESNLVFSGLLYEPRKTHLLTIKDELSKHDIFFDIRGRERGALRISDDEYWNNFSSHKYVLTTTGQISDPNYDRTDVAQLVYRFLEATACGSCLIAQNVPGSEIYFKNGENIFFFESKQDLIDFLIRDKKSNYSISKSIAQNGHSLAQSFINTSSFWVNVNYVLGKDSLK